MIRECARCGGIGCPWCDMKGCIDDQLYCWAGRWATLGGKWDGIPPCLAAPIHVMAFNDEPGGDWVVSVPVMVYCQDHFEVLLVAGLVEEPFMDPAEYRRRMKGGTGSHGSK